MKAITTKYLPVTETKPARVKARTDANKTVTVGCSAFDSDDDAHRGAARQLAKLLGWTGNMASGTTHRGEQVHVFTKDGAGIHRHWPIL